MKTKRYVISQFIRDNVSDDFPCYVNILNAADGELRLFHTCVDQQSFEIPEDVCPELYLLSRGIILNSYYIPQVIGTFIASNRRVLLQLCLLLNSLPYAEVDKLYIVQLTFEHSSCSYPVVYGLLDQICRSAELYEQAHKVVRFLEDTDYRVGDN